MTHIDKSRIFFLYGVRCCFGIFFAFIFLCSLSAFGAQCSYTSIDQRVNTRVFPSIFQAWNTADNLDEPKDITAARHDLIFSSPEYFGLKWEGEFPGLATAFTKSSLDIAVRKRCALLEKNPHLIVLLEIRYRDAAGSYLPEGHPWWLRDKHGVVERGWGEGRYSKLNYSNESFRIHVALQAQVAILSGVADGIMLDWWQDNDDERLLLLKSIRNAIGEKALIMVNTNDRIAPKSARFINGLFMEAYASKDAADWSRISNTLDWAEKNLRKPTINALETWFQYGRTDLQLMRRVTTFAMAKSNAYVLFSDPNDLPSPDHLHNWYPFWTKKIGKPIKPGITREDGLLMREYEHGIVVHNPLWNADKLKFIAKSKMISAGKNVEIVELELSAGDGDLLIYGDALAQ